MRNPAPSMPLCLQLILWENVTKEMLICCQFLSSLLFWFLIFPLPLLLLAPSFKPLLALSLLSEQAHLSLSVIWTSLNLIQAPSFIPVLPWITLLPRYLLHFAIGIALYIKLFSKGFYLSSNHLDIYYLICKVLSLCLLLFINKVRVIDGLVL